jgi:hypothetical protein
MEQEGLRSRRRCTRQTCVGLNLGSGSPPIKYWVFHFFLAAVPIYDLKRERMTELFSCLIDVITNS